MAKEDLTDARLSELISVAKRVTNPGARTRVEGRHLRTDYRVVSLEGSHEFSIFTRQSTRLHTSYSAGLRWLRRGRDSVMLVRCNGPSHEHTNAIEGDKSVFVATSISQPSVTSARTGAKRGSPNLRAVTPIWLVRCRIWSGCAISADSALATILNKPL